MSRATLAVLVLALLVSPAAFAAQEVDTCAAPPFLVTSLPYTDTGTTCGATNDITNYSCASLPFPYPGPDVIYSFAMGAGNSVAFSASLTGSTGDLALFMISTCGNGATCIVTSQDAIGAGAGPEAIPAQNYATGTRYLYIDSYYASPAGTSCGTYTLNVTGTLPVELLNFSVD
jgi:hypothetical protein